MADDCVAIVRDADQRQPALGQQHAHHQRRDARRARVDRVVRQAGRRGLGRLGQRQRHHPGRGRRAGPGRRRGRPGRRARRGRQRAGRATARRPTGPTSRPAPASRSTTTSHPRWARRSAGPAPRAGCSTASSTTRSPPPTSARPPGSGSATSSRPATSRAPARPPTSPTAPGSAAPPATSPTSTRWPPRRSWPSGSAWGKRRVDLEAGRYDTILPPTAVADLMIYAYWLAGARDAWEGQSVYSRHGRPAPGSARRSSGPRSPSTPTRRTPGCSARRSRWPRRRPTRARSSTTASSSAAPTGSATASSPRCARPGTPPTMTEQPVTPAIDNLVLEVDGAAGSVEDLVAGTERGLLLTCMWYIREVDPQTAAAHRADPRRRLPRRGRRDHRRGQQLPLEREPGRPAAPLLARLGDGAELQPRVGRRLLLAHGDARAAGPRLQHVERVAGAVAPSEAPRRRTFGSWRQPWTRRTEQQVHPLDEPPTSRSSGRRRRSRSPRAPGAASAATATRERAALLPGVLGAYGALDYGFYRALAARPHRLPGRRGVRPDDDRVRRRCRLPVRGRRGRADLRLGPLLAGLVLGAGPCAWIVLDYASYVAPCSTTSPRCGTTPPSAWSAPRSRVYPGGRRAAPRCRARRPLAAPRTESRAQLRIQRLTLSDPWLSRAS